MKILELKELMQFKRWNLQMSHDDMSDIGLIGMTMFGAVLKVCSFHASYRMSTNHLYIKLIAKKSYTNGSDSKNPCSSEM